MRLPFAIRVAYLRLRRYVDWRVHPLPWATERGRLADYPMTLVERASPLQRAPDGAIAAYTAEKTENLRLACARLDGLLLAPDTVFSFCRCVGKTDARAGYLPALEMHDGVMLPSIGGGLCQLSNMLYLLALEMNAEILERHRHSYDLFRDVERSMPFGCGATVFYNYIDLQFRNRLPFPVLLHVAVAPPLLRAALLAAHPLPFRVDIEETDHCFVRRAGQIYRKNRLWRTVAWHDDRPATRELLCENCCRVRYPADDLIDDVDTDVGGM